MLDRKSLATRLKINDFVIRYLEDNGYETDEEIIDFLYPKLSNLPDPFNMHGMTEGVDFIIDCIEKRDKIIIWGDYDVDGITGTAILYDFLRNLGIEVSTFIPNRLTDGYGLNINSIDRLAANSTPDKSLIITVDCGISNQREVAYAHNLGFKVIITDHHELGAETPTNAVILNAKQGACSFDKHDLSGVGTVFFLLIALRARLKKKGVFENRQEPNLKQYLALTALGTVADLVALTNTNRILIKAGFEVLSNNKCLSKGLSRLLRAVDLEEGVHSTEEISFKIAPLINAAGRLGKPEIALHLLLSNDNEEAQMLAETLIQLNVKRKQRCKKDLDISLTLISHQAVISDKCIIIFGDFHNGVVGITASKLVERFNVPAIVFSQETDSEGTAILKGSCRSINGVNILKALELSSEFTRGFGGHKAAAGVTVLKSDFTGFKLSLINTLKNNLADCKKDKAASPYRIGIDETFTQEFLNGLKLLEPTGEKCPKPVFIDETATVVQSKRIGKDKEHLQLIFRGRDKNHRGVGFNLADHDQRLRDSPTVSVEYTPHLNKFNKRESWQVMVSNLT